VDFPTFQADDFTKVEPLLDAMNRIGGVMVSWLASSGVDRGFDPQSGKTKDYKVGI
jgi:hypothetical protein